MNQQHLCLWSIYFHLYYIYRDISTKCADAIDYVESLIDEYSEYKFLLDNGKGVSVENLVGEKTKITFQNLTIPGSVDVTQFITTTITKNTKRVTSSFSLVDYQYNLNMYYIDGVFIIPGQETSKVWICHTVKKPEECIYFFLFFIFIFFYSH